MAMYTQFYLDCKLKSETPIGVVHVLMELAVWRGFICDPKSRLLMAGNDTPEAKAFIGMQRWDQIGTRVDLDDCHQELLHDGLGNNNGWYFFFKDGNYHLLIGGQLINYQQTIQAFWNYIKPWIDAPFQTEVGRIRYEEYALSMPIHAGCLITKTGANPHERNSWADY
jgi:hypothetical protein